MSAQPFLDQYLDMFVDTSVFFFFFFKVFFFGLVYNMIYCTSLSFGRRDLTVGCITVAN